MLDPLTQHPPNREPLAASASMPCATAGQRAAAAALGEAVAQRQPIILLFGDAGVGKTTLVGSFLAALDPQEFSVIHVSATSGEFVGPPSFDALLEVMCRRLASSQPSGQRPATLAVLAAAVGALGRAGRTLLLAIDHADHLTNNVIAEATRLREYLDPAPGGLVCILIGSPTLASRLDTALHRPGVAKRIPEIRVAHPSEDELAALLAYEDTAQPGGPILTPGAIDRINVYAKSNLNWAAPLADAARTLAANQGEREVTPEVVRGALFELWSPDQAPPGDSLSRTMSTPIPGACNPEPRTKTPPGMSDFPIGSLSGADAGTKPPFSPAADPVSPVTGSMTSDKAVVRRASAWRPAALWIAVATSALLIAIGFTAIEITDTDKSEPAGQSQPDSALPKPAAPGVQSPAEPGQAEVQSDGAAEPPAQTNSASETEPAPSSDEKPEADAPKPEGRETSLPTPAVPAVAPPPSRSQTSSRAASAPKAKKPAEASRKKATSDKWIQTR